MKKGLFDIEDFAWFFGFMFLLILIVIALSFPGIKAHMPQRMGDLGNELEKSIAMQELSGYLSTKMPPYAELEKAIDATDLKDVKNLDLGKAMEYLKDKKAYYEGKTFAEFIGFLKYNLPYGIDKLANDRDPYADASSLFSIVTIAMFTESLCRYPGTNSVKCIQDVYGAPDLKVQFSVDAKTKLSEIEDEYFDLNGAKYAAPWGYLFDVYQYIPMPNGEMMVVRYSKRVEVQEE
ncbi:MAG: hypothetical protein V1702_05870 [Candidatus Woesearchaeota archaeon]